MYRKRKTDYKDGTILMQNNLGSQISKLLRLEYRWTITYLLTHRNTTLKRSCEGRWVLVHVPLSFNSHYFKQSPAWRWNQGLTTTNKGGATTRTHTTKWRKTMYFFLKRTNDRQCWCADWFTALVQTERPQMLDTLTFGYSLNFEPMMK